MKKQLLTTGFLSLITVASAQEKSDLSQVPNLLSSPKVIETSDEVDLFVNKEFELDGDYTLEVKAKVLEVDKRGMDIEAKSALGEGFRMVVAPDCFLDASKTFGLVSLKDNMNNTVNKTFRFMMFNDEVQVFHNNELLGKAAKTTLEGFNVMNANDAQFDAGVFDGGVFEGWTAGGVGETIEVVDVPTTSPASEQAANRCLHVAFPAKLNNVEVANNMILGLKPGATYDFSYRFLPYLRNAPGGGYNMTIGVYADPSSLTSLVAAWHNGYAYAAGVETDPVWTNYTMRFTVPDDLEYAFIRIIARNNPCNIYFDDFAIKEVEYPSDFPEFKEIPADEAHDRAANTGIYNKTNLWWDYDPGFEYSTHNGSFNATETGILPKEESRWFANGNLNGPGDARTLDTSLSTGYHDVEGKMVGMIRYDYTYEYFSLILPKDRMKPNTAYKARFRMHAFKAPSNNKQFYFRVGDNVKGNSGNIYNSVLVTIPEYIADDKETTDVNEETRNSEYAEISFYTPHVLPDNMYATLRIKEKADILFGVDEFTLVEAAYDYAPKGQISIGKSFFAGSANMEIESIKYTPGAYYPAEYTGISDAKANAKANVHYANGVLMVAGVNGNRIEVSTLAGAQVFVAPIAAESQSYHVALAPGVYIAKTGNSVRKIIVE